MLGVHVATERVTSSDNVLADWLSRGDESEVLRVVRGTGLEAVRVYLSHEERSTASLPSSELA